MKKIALSVFAKLAASFVMAQDTTIGERVARLRSVWNVRAGEDSSIGNLLGAKRESGTGCGRVSGTLVKFIPCIYLAIFVALRAIAADPPDANGIQGRWTPVKAELGGQPLGDAVLKTISLKLTDGKYEVLVGDHPDNGTYALDSKTQPKSITVVGTEGPNHGRTFPAIYELKGDTLRICYDLSGRKRPTEFKSVAGTKLYLVTYSRRPDRP